MDQNSYILTSIVLQSLNELENNFKANKMVHKTIRPNCSHRDQRRFREVCNRNLLPLGQVPELTCQAGGIPGSDDFIVGVRFSIKGTIPQVNITLGYRDRPNHYLSKRYEKVPNGWRLYSIWAAPSLTSEERDDLFSLEEESSSILLGAFDRFEITISEDGSMHYTKH